MRQPAASIKFILLALVSISLMYGIYYLNPPYANPSQVEKGEIDISKVLNSSEPINLKGDWLFFYQQCAPAQHQGKYL